MSGSSGFPVSGGDEDTDDLLAGLEEVEQDTGWSEPLDPEVDERPKRRGVGQRGAAIHDPRSRTETGRALAEAEAAVARLNQAVAWMPDELRLGLVRRMAWREAAGWIAQTAKLFVPPRRLAQEDLEGGSGWQAAKSLGHDDLDAASKIGEAMTLARQFVRLATQPGWAPLGETESSEALLTSFGASARLEGDPIARSGEPVIGPVGPRAILFGAPFAAWRQRWFGRGEADLLTAGLAAADWLDAGAVISPTLTQGVFLAAAGVRRKGKLMPLLFWATLGPRREALPARDPDEWPPIFLRAVEAGAREGLAEAERLRDWHAKASAAAGARRAHALDGKIVELLAEYPLVSGIKASEALKCTPQAANRALGRLASAGVAREATGRELFKIFEGYLA